MSNPLQIARTLTVSDRYGIHVKPAERISQTARLYDSKITVNLLGFIADAKNLNELLLLGAEYGDALRLSAEGPDAREAVEEVGRMI